MRFIAQRLRAPWRGNWLSALAKILTHRLKMQGAVSLAIVPPREMRRLNALYRGKNRSTDVLSFALIGGKPAVRMRAGAADDCVGEVILCIPDVAKRARRNRRTALEEFKALTVHGVLHIAGFDHERNRDADRMERLERSILDELAKR